MRGDFSNNFKAEKNKLSNKPVTAIVISWPEIGSLNPFVLRLADRAGIKIDGNDYSPLIKDPGDIHGLTEFSGKQLRITIINALSPSENLPIIFDSRPPELATVTVIQWFDSPGMGSSDYEELFSGMIEDPIGIDQSECRLNIVNISSSYGRRVLGSIIDLTSYPDAPGASVGKVKPIVIGEVDRVPGIPVNESKQTILRSVAVPGDKVLVVASTEDFTSTGKLIINDDEIIYTGKTDSTFTGCSGIEDYIYADEKIYQKLSSYRFLVGDPDYKIKSIGDVRVDGNPAKSSNFSVDVGKCEVVFSKQPKGLGSIDTKFLQVQNTATGSGNNATDPTKSINPSPTSYAKISQTKRVLSVKHTPVLAGIGQIGKVFLRVEHFVEERFSSDRLDAYVGGVKIGTLSPPAVDDKVSSSTSSVNLTHAHLNTLGFPISDSEHGHTEGSPPKFTQTALAGTGGLRISKKGGEHHVITFPSPGPGSWTKAEYGIGFEWSGTISGGTTVIVYAKADSLSYQLWKRQGTTQTYTTGGVLDSPTNTIKITHTATRIEFYIRSATRVVTMRYAEKTTTEASNVSSSKSGSVTGYSGSKTVSGSSEKATRSVVDHFDITSKVGGAWSWFTGKETQIKYVGSTDGRTAFISHVAFEIEFSRRRIEIARSITARVEGVIDNGNGDITGTADSLIKKPVDVFKWSILAIGLDDSLFDAISLARTSLAIGSAYKMAGLINDKSEVRDLWKEWGRSCRSIFYWERGKARALYQISRDGGGGFTVDVEIKTTQIMRKNSISSFVISRSRSTDMSNSIDLNYSRDFENGGYLEVVNESDTDSIALFGRKEKENGFDFNWIRDKKTAGNIAEFNLAENSTPYNIFSFKVFLDNMEIERGDIVKLWPPMYGDQSRYAIVLNVRRYMGSGQNKRMDFLEIEAKEITASV